MKLSVVIPVYNVEPYVADCLRSVLGQTLDGMEIICIHDGGQDRSWDVVKTVTAGDGRVRLVENERNLGLAATRNRGMDLASGEYIYFLDADDMIVPDAMERLYGQARSQALQVQVFGASFLFETPELEERFRTNHARFKREYPGVMTGRELFMAWMDIWDWLSSQPRYFYERRFLTEHGLRFKEGMLHEDETFAFDVLLHARRVQVTNAPLFIRRFRAGSIMTGAPSVRSLEGCVYILEHVAAAQPYYGADPAWNRAVKFYMYKIFRDACRKYRAILQERADGGAPLLPELSPDIRADERRMAIYHLIEAFSLWEEAK